MIIVLRHYVICDVIRTHFDSRLETSLKVHVYGNLERKKAETTNLTGFRVFICLKCKVDHVSGQIKTKNMGVIGLKKQNYKMSVLQ